MTALREAACCSNKFWECHLLVRTLRRGTLSPATQPGPVPAPHNCCRDLQSTTGQQASPQSYCIPHRVTNTFGPQTVNIFPYIYMGYFSEVEWGWLMLRKYFRLLKETNHCSPPL